MADPCRSGSRGGRRSPRLPKRDLWNTDRLVEDHKNLVYHLIRRTVHDRTAHEEVFQKVFLNVLEGLPRFRGGSKLSTWIAAVAVHTCYKFIQKASRRGRVESFGDWLDGWPAPSVPSNVLILVPPIIDDICLLAQAGDRKGHRLH
jgi:DNA-directed RNA polymerase specialized sigma24 family protein